MKKIMALALLAVTSIATTGAFAADKKVDVSKQGLLTGSLGQFDALNGDNISGVFGVEYKFAQLTQKPLGYGLRPIVGAFINSDDGRYAYGGIAWEFDVVKDKFFITPSTAIGAYSGGDDSVDLGGTIEFRSGVELAYQFNNGHRAGLAIHHLSNAGIYDDNPGTETVIATYTVPVF